MTEDTIRPRNWRQQRRRMQRSLTEMVAAYHWWGQRSFGWCADALGISRSTAHRMSHKIGRAGSLPAARRFGLIAVDLSGVAATELVASVDLADVDGGASMSPLLLTLE